MLTLSPGAATVVKPLQLLVSVVKRIDFWPFHRSLECSDKIMPLREGAVEDHEAPVIFAVGGLYSSVQAENFSREAESVLQDSQSPECIPDLS